MFGEEGEGGGKTAEEMGFRGLGFRSEEMGCWEQKGGS
jgi:hypothetical protein